jgi:hypothetical protein
MSYVIEAWKQKRIELKEHKSRRREPQLQTSTSPSFFARSTLRLPSADCNPLGKKEKKNAEYESFGWISLWYRL